MKVTEVWFLKKKEKGDGFEDFHYDFKNSGGGSNCVSFTVNVNMGKMNEENDIATMKMSPSNEEPSILSRSRREEMIQKLSLQEKEECVCVCVCVCFWPPVPRWGPVKHEIPISISPLDDVFFHTLGLSSTTPPETPPQGAC
jgi:hypothetical protein